MKRTAEKRPADELRMKSDDFDAMMRKALGVPPDNAPAMPKVKKKPKAAKRSR